MAWGTESWQQVQQWPLLNRVEICIDVFRPLHGAHVELHSVVEIHHRIVVVYGHVDIYETRLSLQF
jgi:hypothetical protein